VSPDISDRVVDGEHDGERSHGKPHGTSEALEQRRPGFGGDARRERGARRDERDLLDAGGDAELDGVDVRPPREAVVDDDEVRDTVESLWARRKCLRDRPGAGV
jgi:hypothetical protein